MNLFRIYPRSPFGAAWCLATVRAVTAHEAWTKARLRHSFPAYFYVVAE